MLTYALDAKDDSLLVIDEPDIYLHSDLQRQLLSILSDLGPDILIATHSTEIISEADPRDLLVVNKLAQSAKRIKDTSGLQKLLELLGSNLNPTLTQLAKSQRGVFVEGKDFQILSTFAQKLGRVEIARRSDFAVIPVDGFNPEKTEEYSKGIELTLGAPFLRAVILDRDYRSEAEVIALEKSLRKSAFFVHIHRRKEIENYLLELGPIERAIRTRIFEQNTRTGKEIEFDEDVSVLLFKLTEKMKHEVSGQFVTNFAEYKRKLQPNLARAQITSEALEIFDTLWEKLESRLSIVPGKHTLAQLNNHLQDAYDISLSPKQIARQFNKQEVPDEIVELIEKLEQFRKQHA